MDAEAELATVDLVAVSRFVDRMGQDGRGVRRRDLVGLAGAAGRDHTMTIEAAPGCRWSSCTGGLLRSGRRSSTASRPGSGRWLSSSREA